MGARKLAPIITKKKLDKYRFLFVYSHMLIWRIT